MLALIESIGIKNLFFVAILSALLGAVGVQTHRLNTRTQELTAANALTLGLRLQIDAQNTGIEAVRAANARAVETGVKANVVAKSIATKAEARAQAIERAPAPADCQQAIGFLIDEAAK